MEIETMDIRKLIKKTDRTLSFEDHIEVGKKLSAIHKDLVGLTTTICNAYRSKVLENCLARVRMEISNLKSHMDSIVFAENRPDKTKTTEELINVYYPGEKK